METYNPPNPPTFSFEKLVDIIIRLGVLFFLVGWCFTILSPFVLILIWAGVIAIALYPLYIFFLKMFRQRKGWASVVLTILMLSILIIPSWLVTQSLYEEVSNLRDLNKQGLLVIPPPGENTANWPSVAKPILDLWKLASEDLQEAMAQYSDQLKAAVAWLLSAVAGIGGGVLQFVASIIIAGVLLAYSTSVGNAAIKIFIKLVGKNGENFANTTVINSSQCSKGYFRRRCYTG